MPAMSKVTSSTIRLSARTTPSMSPSLATSRSGARFT